jgi:hypothetical protein
MARVQLKRWMLAVEGLRVIQLLQHRLETRVHDMCTAAWPWRPDRICDGRALAPPPLPLRPSPFRVGRAPAGGLHLVLVRRSGTGGRQGGACGVAPSARGHGDGLRLSFLILAGRPARL